MQKKFKVFIYDVSYDERKKTPKGEKREVGFCSCGGSYLPSVGAIEEALERGRFVVMANCRGTRFKNCLNKKQWVIRETMPGMPGGRKMYINFDPASCFEQRRIKTGRRRTAA